MKKTFFLLALLFTFLSSFAKPPVTEKIRKQFAAVFPTVAEAKWFEGDHYYDVYFDQDNKKYVIRYDLNGRIQRLRCSYTGEKLCAFLKAKVNEKYPGKSIYGVTEITNDNEMFCILNLEDAKNWITVRISATGQITEMEKFTKAN